MLREVVKEISGAFVDLICFTLTGRIRPYDYRYYNNDWLEDLPKDEVRTKEVYLEIEGVVVKVFLEASLKPKTFGSAAKASFRCRILEIDGRTTTEEERQNGEQKLDSFDCAPTREDEKELLLGALQHFGLTGTPRMVSESFVEDHLRFIEMRNRILSTERS